jgi:hypothetical protein
VSPIDRDFGRDRDRGRGRGRSRDRGCSRGRDLAVSNDAVSSAARPAVFPSAAAACLRGLPLECVGPPSERRRRVTRIPGGSDSRGLGFPVPARPRVRAPPAPEARLRFLTLFPGGLPPHPHKHELHDADACWRRRDGQDDPCWPRCAWASAPTPSRTARRGPKTLGQGASVRFPHNFPAVAKTVRGRQVSCSIYNIYVRGAGELRCVPARRGGGVPPVLRLLRRDTHRQHRRAGSLPVREGGATRGGGGSLCGADRPGFDPHYHRTHTITAPTHSPGRKRPRRGHRFSLNLSPRPSPWPSSLPPTFSPGLRTHAITAPTQSPYPHKRGVCCAPPKPRAGRSMLDRPTRTERVTSARRARDLEHVAG